MGTSLRPATVVLRPLETAATASGDVRVVTYSRFDPVDLQRQLVEALACLDGRPTREALGQIRAERRLNLTPALVRRLVDFGVLTAVEPAGAG